MTLKEQLKSDLKDAMRAKEVEKRDSIRSINTMIKQIEVDERIELDDAKIIQLIQKGIKQREEAILQFKEAQRDDLVQNEQNQINVTTDAKGYVNITWPEAGMYLLEAEYEDDKAEAPATKRTGSYGATFAVFPL